MLAKSRTIEVGGTTFTKDVMTQAVGDWTREHLHAEIQRIANAITDEQLRLGNKPTSIYVDNNSFKKITDAERKIVILYGMELAKAVIRAVERALISAIEISTDKQTGKLADIGNWQWFYFPEGGRGGPIADPTKVERLGLNDVLMLRPKPEIFYATAVNQNVAGGRRSFLLQKNNVKRRGRKAQATNKYGFFGAAARFLRRDYSIRQSFSVYGYMSSWTVPGEVATRGKGGPLQTGQIVLRPKRRGPRYG